MKGTSLALLLTGVALLSWCGVQLALGLQMSRGVEISLAGYAVAVMLLVAGPIRALSQRVALLERQLANVGKGTSNISGHAV
jgi:hypothetical protein